MTLYERKDDSVSQIGPAPGPVVCRSLRFVEPECEVILGDASPFQEERSKSFLPSAESSR